MEYLHEEIKLDIFSRLPIESVLECRRVCKTWNALLHLSHFAHMHLNRGLKQLDDHYFNNATSAASGPVSKGLLILASPSKMNVGNLYYLEHDGNDELSYKTLKRINHPQIKQYYNNAIVDSCNGLVCLSIRYPKIRFRDPTYIWNPITREYMNLPRFSEEQNDGQMVSGFGYAHSSNEYKVVRIYYRKGQLSVGQVQVYTLGSGTGWRNKGEITYCLVPAQGCRDSGIFANGALHWVEYDKWNIIAFDLAKEEFYLLPLLPCFPPRGCRLYRLGGCLCVIYDVYDNGPLNKDRTMNIWSWKKCGEWERMFSMLYRNPSGIYYQPFTMTKSGELLFWIYWRSIYRYDQQTATIKRLVNLDTKLHFHQVASHMNSCISLKALGEKCRRRRTGCKENLIS